MQNRLKIAVRHSYLITLITAGTAQKNNKPALLKCFNNQYCISCALFQINCGFQFSLVLVPEAVEKKAASHSPVDARVQLEGGEPGLVTTLANPGWVDGCTTDRAAYQDSSQRIFLLLVCDAWLFISLSRVKNQITYCTKEQLHSRFDRTFLDFSPRKHRLPSDTEDRGQKYPGFGLTQTCKHLCLTGWLAKRPDQNKRQMDRCENSVLAGFFKRNMLAFYWSYSFKYFSTYLFFVPPTFQESQIVRWPFSVSWGCRYLVVTLLTLYT